uniref:Putative serine/threonine-protein phosphatase 4 regulatory subunit 2 n=1 Tax=Anopheles darlingi TaxID=43151 RepID=A0A2M4CRD0_ANODA
MENQEEILLLLERFTKSKQKDIPRELEDYLNFVARTGDTVYRWVLVKPLFREKLVNVITDFHDNTPSIADLPPCPNVDPFNYERMKRALLERLDSFNSAPFTVQRICELLTEPRKQYTRIDKFMRAVEKNILVVSTQEPGRGRSDSENGDSLDSIVNGDLEVNVDIEMDNEHFHLEADALLPDSSDAVGGLHNALAEASHHPASDRGDHELNGTGSFMTENNQFIRSETAAVGTGISENAPIIGIAAVVDTNENATDGDIATPLLETANDSSSVDNDSEAEQPDTGATEEEQVKSEEALPEEALTGAKTEEEVSAKSATMTQETIATQEEDATTTEVTEQSEATKTPSEEPVAEQVVGHAKEEAQDSPEQPLQQLTEDPSPTSKVDTERDEPHSDAQHAQQSEDGEPCAKIGKYELGEQATEVVDVTVSSNTANSDTTDSSGGSGADAPSSESSSSPSSSSSSSNDERFPIAIAKPQPSVNAGEVKESETPQETQPQHTEQQQQQEQPLSDILATTIDPTSSSSASNSDQTAVEAAIAGKEAEEQQQQLAVKSEETQASTATETIVSAAVPILAQPTTATEVVGTVMEATASVAPSDVSLVTTPAPVADQTAGEDEMELAVTSTAATAASLPNTDNVMEEDVVPVAELDDGTKTEDNVMDIDESSVEPMDQ